jgi:spore coat polysaccharide biosynthesis protein SpsF
MKFFGFITVRSDSSRLPQKALLPIRGRKIIEHIIDRAKVIRGLDGVVVCTSDRPQDDVLEKIAQREGVLCFRGSLEDKLERWRGAAEKFGADYIITLDGDDPFFDPELIELEIKQIKEEEPDFLNIPKGLVCGASEFGIRTKALQKVCAIKDTRDTEMMWVYFTDTGLFKVVDFKVTDPIFWNEKIRLTLDYPEDYEFFKRVFEELNMTRNTIPLRVILKLLEEKPEIPEINLFRQQEFLDNQRRKTSLKVKLRKT